MGLVYEDGGESELKGIKVQIFAQTSLLYNVRISLSPYAFEGAEQKSR